MGRMKEVFILKQELAEKDPSYQDMPDSYFINLYLQKRDEIESSGVPKWLSDMYQFQDNHQIPTQNENNNQNASSLNDPASDV